MGLGDRSGGVAPVVDGSCSRCVSSKAKLRTHKKVRHPREGNPLIAEGNRNHQCISIAWGATSTSKNSFS